VLATASGEGVALVKALGADVVIDSRATRFEEGLERVDAVIDLVGGETQTRSFSVLRRGGRLVSAVSTPDAERARALGVDAEFFIVRVNTARLNEIAARVDAGALATKVGCVLPLTEAVTAHEMLAGLRPHPRGKIVLKVR
jgi:NADPH:quinone reductase-like Zn-dependent oxidoreductase